MKNIIYNKLREIKRIIFQKKAQKDEDNFYTKSILSDKRYSIGDWTYGNPRVLSWNNDTELKIGKFCSIAENVIIFLDGEHRTDWVTTYPFSAIFDNASSFKGHPTTKGNVTIGNDVWIGFGSTILSGIAIGNGAVIAAKSVVTKNVEPYAIVGGNPAKFIKYRFSKEVIDGLQSIEWWNWDLDKISENWELLLSNKVEEFVLRYHSGNIN